MKIGFFSRVGLACMILVMSGAGSAAEARLALFGDLHVHTRYSFDAYIFNVRATPDDAYRYAKGEPLKHALGYPIRLRGGPLDFYAVTDHATYLGVLDAFGNPQDPLSRSALAAELISSDRAVFGPAFQKMAGTLITGEEVEGASHPDVRRRTWKRIVDAAEEHNDPGRFTTFAGFEYTSNPPYNLHRNVIFQGSSVPDLPFAATDSLNPEDLWRWLDAQRESGIEAMAIPHNSNWSNGLMFQRTTFDGKPIDAEYAALRMRNEPLVEITQVKGTSDSHPLLSPNDEWADFEIFADTPDAFLGGGNAFHNINLKGSYAREALLTGLQMQAVSGFNPYRFGLIGSSDTHNAGGPYEEEFFYSKVGASDGTPARRGSTPPDGMSWVEYEDVPANKKPSAFLTDWSASGLAGVWAAENTRQAIYQAMRRKETFATSGTRIQVRMWAGYGLNKLTHTDASDSDALYSAATAMGGDLVASDRPVEIVAQAVRDPQSAWLQRLQVVKGWIEDGEQRERVYDLACSDGLVPDHATHRCPDNGATVDLQTCALDAAHGDTALSAHWTDPDFERTQLAFYYVRVLENPTCRWSTWDALRAGIEPMTNKEAVIQERAWTSPVWYLP
ncbi:MAG: DUF3604 domain-containing protein [Proteobacteria bacterium]|nr:DUF3604 domain-containing protein [Pseudomonadota bacterium]